MRVNPQPKPLSSKLQSRLEKVDGGRIVCFGDVMTVTGEMRRSRDEVERDRIASLVAEMDRRNAWVDERSGVADCEGQSFLWSHNEDN